MDHGNKAIEYGHIIPIRYSLTNYTRREPFIQFIHYLDIVQDTVIRIWIDSFFKKNLNRVDAHFINKKHNRVWSGPKVTWLGSTNRKYLIQQFQTTRSIWKVQTLSFVASSSSPTSSHFYGALTIIIFLSITSSKF